MSFNEVFMWLISAGTLLGGIDYLTGNHLGFGAKFKEGFDSIAPLSLSMAGIIVIAPALARLLAPVVSPLFRMIGTDPAFLGAFLGPNLGGYMLASSLADDPLLGMYSGQVVAGLLGSTISYIIPMGMGIIEKEDQNFFIKGLLLGIIAMPFGSLAGGLAAGIPMAVLWRNLLFVTGLAAFLVAGLLFFQDKMIAGFSRLSRGITFIATAGLIVGGIQNFLGVELIPGTTPVMDALKIPASVALSLMGCLPFIELMWRCFKKLFEAVGRLFGINGVTVEGLILACATGIAVFKLLKDMNPKGKVAAIAWLCGSMGMFTACLVYCMQVSPAMCMPQLLAKALSGSISLAIACIIPAKSSFYKS